MRGHNQHLRSACIGIVVGCAFASTAAMADVPTQMNIQGILKDSNDAPMPDSIYAVTFRIYSTAGQTIWSEETSVTTVNGLFSATLGLVTPIPATLFGSTNRRLGIQVQGYPEMTPLTQLTSVPFAYESAQWTSGGANLYRASGKVGIGTTSPAQRLHIAGLSLGDGILLTGSSPGYSLQAGGGAAFGEASASGLWSQSADSGDAVVRSGSGRKLHLQSGFGAAGVTLTSTGNVGIGYTESNFKLAVNGSVWAQTGISANGTIFTYAGVTALGDMWASNVFDQQTSCPVVWSCSSDRRLKTNIEPLQNSVDEIFKLSAVRFDWRRDEFPGRGFPEGRQIGLIAQDVQKVVPGAVQENEDGYLSVDYARLVPLLVGSIKEQQGQIESLQSTIQQQQQDIEALKRALRQ